MSAIGTRTTGTMGAQASAVSSREALLTEPVVFLGTKNSQDAPSHTPQRDVQIAYFIYGGNINTYIWAAGTWNEG